MRCCDDFLRVDKLTFHFIRTSLHFAFNVHNAAHNSPFHFLKKKNALFSLILLIQHCDQNILFAIVYYFVDYFVAEQTYFTIANELGYINFYVDTHFHELDISTHVIVFDRIVLRYAVHWPHLIM